MLGLLFVLALGAGGYWLYNQGRASVAQEQEQNYSTTKRRIESAVRNDPPASVDDARERLRKRQESRNK